MKTLGKFISIVMFMFGLVGMTGECDELSLQVAVWGLGSVLMLGGIIMYGVLEASDRDNNDNGDGTADN